ncbi:hypothetical protein O7600_01645 [Micromonospora sp. WMMA1998]|uniref:hypothetical protein n=1 Tax=Micromonospora sp. WMMA1998 TaxID=3015167 RepID=UPI00248CAD85|nr:hypothetical protein [Micromonospora sp. WMMA1998]WBC15568.1 hypothetical protein O7600_01645 [Micromonospora sp. WMMA1998]
MFAQTLLTKLAEELLKLLVEWLAPKVLRSVPHLAPPDCPRCGGYGVARWAPRWATTAFVLSVLTFAWGFTATVLGLPVVVLVAAVGVRTAWHGDLVVALPGLLAPLGLVGSGAVTVAGATGMAWYHSFPPRLCRRCHGRWPRRDRADYLRMVRSVVFACRCGQRLRAPGTPAGVRVRCPRCGTERLAPTVG